MGCYVYRRGKCERYVAREGREDKTALGLLTSQIYELRIVQSVGVLTRRDEHGHYVLGLGNGQRIVSLELYLW